MGNLDISTRSKLWVLQSQRNSWSPSCAFGAVHECNAYSCQIFSKRIRFFIFFIFSCNIPFFNLLQNLIFRQLCTLQCIIPQLLQCLQHVNRKLNYYEISRTSNSHHMGIIHFIISLKFTQIRQITHSIE